MSTFAAIHELPTSQKFTGPRRFGAGAGEHARVLKQHDACSFVFILLVRLFQIDDGRVAVKRKRAGASDSQVEQLAVMSVRAFEDNDLVGASPAFSQAR